MEAYVLERPDTFDLVARVKEVTGQALLPGDDRLWILGQRLVFTVDGHEYAVPAGFVTDGFSLPKLTGYLVRVDPLHPDRMIIPWDPWGEPQRWAAIAHDFLYAQHGMSRFYADDVFCALLASEGIPTWIRKLLWLTAKLTGNDVYVTAQNQGPIVYPPE